MCINVYAIQDHLVPSSASQALGRLCRSRSRDYSEFSFEGCHIGIHVSSRAQREVPYRIASWLVAR